MAARFYELTDQVIAGDVSAGCHEDKFALLPILLGTLSSQCHRTLSSVVLEMCALIAIRTGGNPGQELNDCLEEWLSQVSKQDKTVQVRQLAH